MKKKHRVRKLAVGLAAAGAMLGMAGALLNTKKGKSLQREAMSKGKVLGGQLKRQAMKELRQAKGATKAALGKGKQQLRRAKKELRKSLRG